MRFIAAIFVVAGHCQAVLYNHEKISPYSPYFNKLASFGVDFFFVLSGFLISYLLLMELRFTGKINIKNFLVRRALRLWPLYFVVGIILLSIAPYYLSFFELDHTRPPTNGIINNFLYLICFGINVQIMIGDMNTFSTHTVAHFWSLSIEEQFYLLWAPLLFLCRKYTLYLITIFIFIGIFVSYYPPSFYYSWFDTNTYAAPYYFTFNRYFHFATGALLAWLFINAPYLFDLQRFTIVVKILFILTIALIFRYLFGAYYYDLDERFINGFVSFLIIAIAIDKNCFFNLEYKWLKYFGKISFGIYVYHIVGVYLSLKCLNLLGLSHHSILFWISFPLLASFFATGIAIISYEYFEKYFLNLKNTFK